MSSDMKIINYLQAGIKAETARQSAIANNMANMNTEGYRKFDVKFADAFARAVEDGSDFDPEEMEPELFQPESGPINEFGNDVNLHAEVGELVKNTLRHKAFVRILKKTYDQYDLAMRTP